MAEIVDVIPRKCIDGKTRLKELKNYYCKHYKFSRDLMDGGCCFGNKKYSECEFKKPKECENFELKKE